MLYSGPYGKSLVSQEFLQQCVNARVQAVIQPFPNPGDPSRSARLITFTSFTDNCVHVQQRDKKNSLHVIPPRGELKIMLKADEELPIPKEEKECLNIS